MRAADIMTTAVVTVHTNTTVQALAALLSGRGISGVPVVDLEGRMVGIVSEGDLLHRAEIGTEHRSQARRSWWLEMIHSDADDRKLRDYVKSHARTVDEVMTREVISVAETTDLAEIASLLETKRIKRVPVVRDGKPIGIVSRANLVRALAAATDDLTVRSDNDDETIRLKLLGEVRKQGWGYIFPEDLIVQRGIVHLWFSSRHTQEQRKALHIAAENIAGVKWVEEHVVSTPAVPWI